MKKILFASTALLAAGAFVSSAQASDKIKLSVGGYMKQWVAVGEQDGDYATRANSFDVASDAEVHFKGSTTLDNGMKITVRTELEANSDSDSGMDEVYMDLSGKYGALRVGSDDTVAVRSLVQAPSVSPLFAAGDGSNLEAFLPVPQAVIQLSDSISGGDDRKLSYYTPKMYGLQAGVSYTPSESSSAQTATKAGSTGAGAGGSVKIGSSKFDDAWAATMTYSAAYSGVGVDASVGYEMADTNADTDSNEATLVTTGLSLSYMGFTVGGAFISVNDESSTEEGHAYNVGVQYKEGPYGVSFSYFNSEAEGTQGNNTTDDVQEYQLAGTYALGAGVTLFGEIDYVDSQDETKVESAGNEGAIGGAVGLALSF